MKDYFEELLINDKEIRKQAKQTQKDLTDNQKNFDRQVETARMPPPQPELVKGKVFKSHQKIIQDLEDSKQKRDIQIKEKDREFLFKRAKELRHHDPPGYEKWYKKAKYLVDKERLRENKRLLEREHTRDR